MSNSGFSPAYEHRGLHWPEFVLDPSVRCPRGIYKFLREDIQLGALYTEVETGDVWHFSLADAEDWRLRQLEFYQKAGWLPTPTEDK